MKEKVLKYSLISIGIMAILYMIMYIAGYRFISTIEKALIVICIIIGIVNLGAYILKVIKENKIINAIICFQMALVAVFICCILLKNFNINMYMVNKAGKNYMMKVNVNDNSKEYYLCKNKYIIYRNYCIKEYLMDTILSYEENTPSKIVYNKKILPDSVDKEIIDSQKKIVASKIIENYNTRIVEYVNNIDYLNEFCKKYELDNNYDSDYFEEKSLIIVSYIPFREVIPYIAKGEDGKLYVYLKDNNDNDFNTKSFCFIEIEKQENVQEIILENYDETMKNNIVK